ncbi:unnamed protein product [Oikopleura dioica]|uniref:Uncharacterized protein n=1 Tax=Oikopleura dioica TaxID=34765 RepID=E4YH68_OIKDI|nr:unnamed protein product [Oikopleura dioica]
MKISSVFIFLSATNGQKPAELKVFKTQSKLEWVIDTFYAESFPKWSRGMKAKTKRVGLKLVDEFKRKQTEMESECFEGSGDGPEQKMAVEIEQENVANLRFVQDDPCRGSKQLTRNMIKWANENILDYGCDGAPKEEQTENGRKDRLVKKWEKMQRRFQTRLQCE